MDSPWKPIATAPRDGTRIIDVENFKRINGETDKEYPPEMLVVWWHQKGWVCYGLFVVSFEPTHWKPCPELPAEEVVRG